MKVTFPHMGHLSIVGKGLFDQLGVEVVVPPPITKKTLKLGIEHAQEFSCLPLKIILGNFIEAAELGADTIVTSGGVGPCRFGYYAQVHREILQDLGYHYEIIVVEPPDTHFSELIQKISYLSNGKSLFQVARALRMGWAKARAIDVIEQKVQQVRPREVRTGTADDVFQWSLKKIDAENEIKKIWEIQRKTLHELDGVPKDMEKTVLKIAVIGEIYTILEPFVTFDIEKHLGRLGVEVSRSIYLSEWINDHLFMGLMRVRSTKEAAQMASPYLRHFVGGHGRETVGSAVRYAREGYHGAIQLAPLTCMPEIVAQTILPVVSAEEEMPVMTIYFDEQSGEAGLVTRLEAFIEMLYRKNDFGKRRVQSERLFRN
ncbi:acyl-CoA dehydratase activase-related protein [Dehalobacterium formicoaceticum]|uniref:Acyl-CoA dehydratase activase-related protein n=1 Tax=Dehalobacterium formicoaceticum TaxID=51515 RepID=A0ABT1Y4N4_9FIRM|nr:acyl-CoA dehydratase activase-related protein [Dehalobacterium formicoaceticum]MCR6545838.1 acyl-CoA dehydratase activase-related protein [Dehalobacterium formicoaceticum]